MRVGMAGLAALYWPVCMGNGLMANKDVEFVSAATLDLDEKYINDLLGMTPCQYAEKYKVRLYNDAEEMVKKESLDTVVLITRHTEHAQWVERMAKLGVNIFIPKTFATTAEDADRIVAAGARYGVKIASGPTARFLPQMAAVKNAVDKGLIGKPFAVRICHHHGTLDVFNKNDWYRDRSEGGPELSLGWYGIDLVLQLMGSNVKKVFATYGNYTTPDGPFMDCGRMDMHMDNGAFASFDMYFCNRIAYPSWQLEIIGPEGVISIHRSNDKPYDTVVCLDSTEGCRELPIPDDVPHWEHFWINDFLKGNTPAVTAEYASTVTKISLAAAKSAQTGLAADI